MDDLVDGDKRILALDQESYGFSQGAGDPWLIVRGISDFGKKAQTKQQLVAALAAVAVSRDLLESDAASAMLDDA